MSSELSNKVAVVTGAASGLGHATVLELAARGAVVVAVDVAPELPDDLHMVTCYRRMDVSRADLWADLAEMIRADHGRWDILVNNAGIATYHSVDDLSEDDWNRVIDVDQKGVWLGMRAAIPLMMEAGAGSIINMSSILGVAAREGIHSYHAAKGAVLSMTRNAAVTYARHGIRVNAVVPGFIRTPATDSQAADINEQYIRDTPLGRSGDPRDVALGIAYLASDDAAFVTGTSLTIDGGYLAR